jgi:hypothetical protein
VILIHFDFIIAYYTNFHFHFGFFLTNHFSYSYFHSSKHTHTLPAPALFCNREGPAFGDVEGPGNNLRHLINTTTTTTLFPTKEMRKPS